MSGTSQHLRPRRLRRVLQRTLVLLVGGAVGFGVAGLVLDDRPPADSPVAAPSATATAAAPAVEPTNPVDDGLAGDATPTTEPAAAEAGVVTDVIDGDTVEVAGLGSIRVIGIDTPERGECGDNEATQLMSSLVLDNWATLVPGARDDRDRYGRLLRYVDVSGVDAGRELIAAGLAVARYDSRDGYGAHPREDDYVALDARTPDRSACAAAEPEPEAEAAPVPVVAAPAAEPWNEPGPDLDCADIGHPVTITGPDYHRLDRDGDGVGCDS